jgi:signal transduction histidine kinase
MTPLTPRARILVAEDSRTQAEALRSLLADASYDVRVAKSGGAALIELRRDPADLVISDVIMPGMTGLELCRAIRSDDQLQDTPFVILTSLADPLDVVRGLEAGADNYVTKPYEPELLLSRIERTLASRRHAPNVGKQPPIDISFLGGRLSIRSSREQILDVLVSSFEDVAKVNQALRAAEEERERLYEQERIARAAAEEARQRAEDANKAKSEFLAMMSHDLRTPLNAIGGYSELLAMGVRGPVNDAQLADLERIRRNQRHLLTLVNDVLNFARLETGEIPLSIKPQPLDPIVRPLRAVIETQAATRNIAYEYIGCDDDIRVAVDSERLEQILINLLGNAVKFTPEGGRVSMACRDARSDFAYVDVTDTGVGIPAAKLDEIFDPFVQGENHGARREGVGLGLAISRKLARAMGGDITVESVEGKGSTFSVAIPRATPAGV